MYSTRRRIIHCYTLQLFYQAAIPENAHKIKLRYHFQSGLSPFPKISVKNIYLLSRKPRSNASRICVPRCVILLPINQRGWRLSSSCRLHFNTKGRMRREKALDIINQEGFIIICVRV